jgi:hypothetical protein
LPRNLPPWTCTLVVVITHPRKSLVAGDIYKLCRVDQFHDKPMRRFSARQSVKVPRLVMNISLTIGGMNDHAFRGLHTVFRILFIVEESACSYFVLCL